MRTWLGVLDSPRQLLSPSSPAERRLSALQPRRLACRRPGSSGRPARRHPLVKILAYNEGMLSVKTVITSAFALLLIGSVGVAQEEALPGPPGPQPHEIDRTT